LKVVILAGGFGTRLSEETDIRPKPMVEIGGMPILWHIMKLYSYYGFHEFVILLGYKGYMIKDFFNTYFLRRTDFVIDLKDNSKKIIKDISEPWKIHLIDTGLNSLTGGRIKRAEKILNNEKFLLTYGDAVSNVNIRELVDSHNNSNKKITMTAVQPEGKFGALNIDQNSSINVFNEKPKGDGTWVNGGFFVCESEVLNYIEDDSTMFEKEPLSKLAKEGNMNAFKHTSFWQCMDNLRDKNTLIDLWDSGTAPWKLWED
tara:strand:- start:1053 stop:1829 length:777 start_codon:yes stop_codon:yes gene_type:complete